MQRFLSAPMLMTSVLLFTACGGSSSTPDAAGSIDAFVSSAKSVDCATITPDKTVTVNVGGSAFVPTSTTISVNQTVRFMTSASHPVKSGTPASPTNDFQTNGDGCFRFTQAGTFPFFCSVHLFTGSIVVQ